MTLRGPEGFDQFYRNIYGERWDSLRRALERSARHTSIEMVPGSPYYLDDASVEAVRAANIQPDMLVLDLCAAPGGKSLALLDMVNGEIDMVDGEIDLVANERSRKRRDRLKRVFENSLTHRSQERVRITGHDATRWSLYEQEAYDAVLLDVPCSAERHLLQHPAELAKWSAARTKRLATQSYAMLASALDVVRSGGIILFSTCTISPSENDDVVEKLLRKRPGVTESESSQSKYGERTRVGIQISPDRDGDRGPLYFSRIKKS